MKPERIEAANRLLDLIAQDGYQRQVLNQMTEKERRLRALSILISAMCNYDEVDSLNVAVGSLREGEHYVSAQIIRGIVARKKLHQDTP